MASSRTPESTAARRAEAIAELQLALQQRPNFPQAQAQAWLAAARGEER